MSTSDTSRDTPESAIVERVEEWALKKRDDFDNAIGKMNNPVVKSVQDISNLRPSVIVLGIVVPITLLTIYWIGYRALINLVGSIYPLYKSFRSIKTASVGAERFWLTYWIIFGGFAIVESIGDLVLGWVPFYNLLKLFFLVWAQAPQTKGAELIFTRFVEPFMTEQEPRIDSVVNKMRNAREQAMQAGMEGINNRAKGIVRDIVSTALPDALAGAPFQQPNPKNRLQ